MENKSVTGAQNIIVDGMNLGAVQLNGMYYTFVLFWNALIAAQTRLISQRWGVWVILL